MLLNLFISIKVGPSSSESSFRVESTSLFDDGVGLVVIDKMFLSAIHSEECILLVGGGAQASVNKNVYIPETSLTFASGYSTDERVAFHAT